MFTITDIEIQKPLLKGHPWLVRAVSRDGARKRVIELQTDDPLELFARIEKYVENNGDSALKDAIERLKRDPNDTLETPGTGLPF